MKKALFLATLLTCWSVHTNADTKLDSKTSSSFSGTIGPIVKISQLGDGVITTIGGRVNATFFKMLIVGLGGHGAVAQSKLSLGGTAEDISYYYGALGVGIRLFPDSFIHLTNYNNFGLGSLNLKKRAEKSLVFSIEPELNLEVDILSLIRIGAGVSYRMMFAKNIVLPAKELFGFGGQVFIEAGWL